jgi:hypothetical protein
LRCASGQLLNAGVGNASQAKHGFNDGSRRRGGVKQEKVKVSHAARAHCSWLALIRMHPGCPPSVCGFILGI